MSKLTMKDVLAECQRMDVCWDSCEWVHAQIKDGRDIDCLNDAMPMVAGWTSRLLALLDDLDIPLTAEVIEAGLTNEDAAIRNAWVARRGLDLTATQYARAITDPAWYVRGAVVRRTDLKPTQVQHATALQDPNPHIRMLWAYRLDLHVDCGQLQAGLADEEENVRRAWGYHPAAIRYLRNLKEAEAVCQTNI